MYKLYKFVNVLLIMTFILLPAENVDASSLAQGPTIIKVSVQFQSPEELKQLSDLIVRLGEVKDREAVLYVYD